ncbi:M23 family metallopeptidase [Lysobacter sp. 5GHs7-4]|uniref:M23 family metallopeptidase n=1 Tax=Lysobacter sp. 5GHs7-4 TaxID=2904253 RepID=UPI001E2CDAFC|nr:M23 family metallopeptidase [Lysobacter sp. 5GHs7-4]UHQ22961.1 M23 family metallopeptidase [Lysobacter sp. 5GHs7-4]
MPATPRPSDAHPLPLHAIGCALALSLNLLWPHSASAQTDVAPQVALAPVEVRTPWAPAAVVGGDGRSHLAYELHVSNFYRDTGVLRLRRIAVYADAQSAPLASFEGQALAQIVQAQPADDAASDGVLVAAGMRAIAFVWLTLPAGTAAPHTLRHRLEFVDAKGALQLVDGARVAVDATPPVRLGPPLRAGLWLASEGPGNSRSHHWGSLVAANGQVTIPQRYALDVFGLDDHGRALRNGALDLRKSKREDWIGYGSDVLAVADGVVRDVRDGQPDHSPLEAQPEPESLTAAGLYGNYVVLEIAPQVFVHYAHLQPGSVGVKVGQKVQQGATLGRMGQSGNTNGPHLHIHVSNAATFEGSEGLPFVFERYASPGDWTLTQAIDPASTFSPKREPHRDQMPLDGEVMGF